MSTCNKCRFGMADNNVIYCHRAPPVMLAGPDKVTITWPPVRKDSWCGEWKLALKRLFRGHVQS